MHQLLLSSTILLLAAPAFSKTAGELCRGTAAKAADGNWYCSEVTTITYRNISQAGQYNVTTGVDPDRGLCSHEKVSYSGRGSMTPLFGQLSMHLRGPMNVSQIAVYELASTISKQDNQDPSFLDQTVPSDFDAAVEQFKKSSGQPRIQDSDDDFQARSNDRFVRRTYPSLLPPPPAIGGGAPNPSAQLCATPCVKTVTTTVFVTAAHCKPCHPNNEQTPIVKPCTCSKSEATAIVLPSIDAIDAMNAPYQQPAVPTKFITLPAFPRNSPPGFGVASKTGSLPVIPNVLLPGLPLSADAEVPLGKREETASTREPASKTEPAEKVDPEVVAAAAAWKRIAYYTSTSPAEATGFAFLANLGDDRKSGTFDYSFGNSLGFVTKDGRKIASEATPFDGVLDTSEAEIAAFTDKPCDEGCDYWRPKSVANYGWEGEDKAFFIQFQMDHYDNIGNDQGMLSDAPAWWFLNAAIPRILQYGNDRNNIPCSCWITGCGEFDAFEVLGRGETRAKSTIHRQGNIEGGDSNYFRRPVGRMLKFAVVFHNFNITAAVLPDSFDFSPALSEQVIADIVAYDPNSSSHSLFAIGD